MDFLNSTFCHGLEPKFLARFSFISIFVTHGFSFILITWFVSLFSLASTTHLLGKQPNRTRFGKILGLRIGKHDSQNVVGEGFRSGKLNLNILPGVGPDPGGHYGVTKLHLRTTLSVSIFAGLNFGKTLISQMRMRMRMRFL